MLHSYKLSCITFSHFSDCSYPPWKRRPICSKSWDAQACVFIHHPWLGKWWEWVRTGGVGDITLGSFFLLPEDTAIGGGGRKISQPYQHDSTQRSNHWVPETAGGKGRVDEWATSKERKRRKERRKKAVFIHLRLHQMTAALQFSA